MEEDKLNIQNENLINTFRDEANELAAELEKLTLELELKPENQDIINRVFRAMHTIKGASAMFGFNKVSELTHNLENIYDDIRENKMVVTPKIIELTFDSIDIIKHFVNTSEASPDYLIKYTNLGKQIDKITGGEVIEESKSIAKNIQEETKTNVFYLFFNPKPDILDDGTNPLYLIQDLHQIGRCIVHINPTKLFKETVPDFAKCHLCWHVLLITENPLGEVENNFMFVDDNSQPRIEALNITKKQTDNIEFLQWFEEESTKVAPIKGINKFFKEPGLIDDDTTHEDKDYKEIQQQHQKHTDEIIKTLSSIRVSSSKIDETLNLISELIIKQAELNILAENTDNFELKEVAENIDALSRRLRDNAFSISLVPLEHSLTRFKRMVRDVSNKFGKKVQLLVEGGDTELHKTIIECIIDPIMHILRNSIDHGIEKPETRIEKGKVEMGTILLKAFYSGANVIIQIIDDGAGINLEKVRQKAVEKELIGEHENPSKEELVKLILHQGFTTTDKVSEVSGRGVGMDVVYQKIREVRGELSIETEKDMGTKMTLQLPLTVSIVDALLVRTGDCYYLIPLSAIVQCEEIEDKENMVNNCLVMNDEYVPIIRLADEFEVESDNPEFEKIIVVEYNDQKVGILTDHIIGKNQAVIKPLGYVYRKQEIISGASVLGTGEVALMLDANKLIKEYSDRKKQEAKEKNNKMVL